MRIQSNVTPCKTPLSAAETVIVVRVRRTLYIYVNELGKHNFCAFNFCPLGGYFLYGKLVRNVSFAKKNHQVRKSFLCDGTF